MSTFTHKQRGELKHAICLELARVWDERGLPKAPKLCDVPNCPSHGTRTPYDIVDKLIRRWAESANCMSLQEAADKVIIRKQKPLSIDEHFISLVYELTQKELEIRKIKYVEVYRGMHLNWSYKNKLPSLRPLTPCSTSLEIAKSFGSNIYKVSIPAKFIASTYYTGYGCAEEFEYVIWGASKARRHFKEVAL